MCLGSIAPLMLGGYFCIAVFGLQFLGGIFNYFFVWNFFLLAHFLCSLSLSLSLSVFVVYFFLYDTSFCGAFIGFLGFLEFGWIFFVNNEKTFGENFLT